MSFTDKLNNYERLGKLSSKFSPILQEFYQCYIDAVSQQHEDLSAIKLTLERYLELVVEQIETPYPFEPFHTRITAPFNYHTFGLDLIRPLILMDSSKVIGLEQVNRMAEQLARKENVILFANHQTEPDPQIINLLLEKSHPQLAANMIFLAGQRVTTDPLAIPLSMGCNLLSVFSKRYIESPPELKHEKLLHNQRTMKRMGQLLTEGGKCIYVAPSGGRDRKNPKTDEIEIAPFDPQSIELFYLIAKRIEHPTHFYPLSLATYAILPPPQSIEHELGEKRKTACRPASLSFGEEIDMEHFPGIDRKEKKINRQKRADYIWSVVKNNYAQSLSLLGTI